jgi:hypothetical protein
MIRQPSTTKVEVKVEARGRRPEVRTSTIWPEMAPPLTEQVHSEMVDDIFSWCLLFFC